MQFLSEGKMINSEGKGAALSLHVIIVASTLNHFHGEEAMSNNCSNIDCVKIA